ncbi:hypothetical protein PR048_014061 [Dryococelus australis]|uniref:DDE-1 domain-containing protein n=1 Tax=Dryococelus australis TaxID=614101 RepID=A0ABQ9HVK2_9NEOP|nr:hypothetical protein PR048_014061 [Dryococelus australis]
MLVRVDIEEELKIRVIKLVQVGFGLARNQICSFAFRICDEKGIPSLFSNNKVCKDWFYGFMRRNNDIANNLSYCRLMRFDKEIVSAHFELLGKSLDKMNLQNRPPYLQSENCSQLVLAGKGCKSLHAAATHGEKGETVTIILYKGKYSKKELGIDLPNGSVFAKTPKGYIMEEEFCNILHHFNSHRIPGNDLLIFDGYHSHLDNSVLDVAESLGIQLFSLPARCSHELQPLVVESLLELSRGQFPEKNPEIPLGKLQLGTWTHAATPKNAMSRFRATGIFPFNPQVIPETDFAHSDVSDRKPLQTKHTSFSATSCTLKTSTIPATPTALPD